MTKRQYLRERPHKEDFFARADESENARLTLQQLLSRSEQEESSGFAAAAAATTLWEAHRDAGVREERSTVP